MKWVSTSESMWQTAISVLWRVDWVCRHSRAEWELDYQDLALPLSPFVVRFNALSETNLLTQLCKCLHGDLHSNLHVKCVPLTMRNDENNFTLKPLGTSGIQNFRLIISATCACRVTYVCLTYVMLPILSKLNRSQRRSRGTISMMSSVVEMGFIVHSA